MRAVSFVLACLLLPAMPFASADPDGVDAPTAGQGATPLGPGTYEGNLSMEDLQDAYVVSHPVGKGVRATLASAQTVQIYSNEAAQDPWDSTAAPDATPGVATLVAASDSGVHLRVSRGEGPATYLLTIEFVDVVDLKVVSITATNVTSCDPACSAGAAVRVEAVFHVLGALPYEGTLQLSAERLGGYAMEPLERFTVGLEPGATLRVITYWRPEVAIGDFHLTAQARSPDERQRGQQRRADGMVVGHEPGRPRRGRRRAAGLSVLTGGAARAARGPTCPPRCG